MFVQLRTLTQRLLVLLVVSSLISSPLVGVLPVAQAATYTAPWATQTAFQSGWSGTTGSVNNDGRIATSTIITPNVDMTTTPGTVTLRSDSLKGTFNESFNGTNGTDYHLDTSSSWATAQTFVTGYSTAVPGNPPVAYYSDSSTISGVQLPDLSSNGHTGTVVNGYNGVTGPTGFGQAIQLNGSNQHIDLANTAQSYTAFTLDAWVLGGNGGRLMANSHTDVDNRGFQFFANSSGFSFNIGNGSTNVSTSVSTSTAIWHHVVNTYDGSNVKMYVDGILVDTKALVGTIPSNTSISIGYNPTYQGDYSNATIAGVAIYNRALSAGEVSALKSYGPYYSPITVNKLARTNVDRFQDISSLVTNIFADPNRQASALAYDSNHNYLFVANSAFLGRINLTTGAKTDLSSKMVWWEDPRYAGVVLSFDAATNSLVVSNSGGGTFIYNTATDAVTPVMGSSGTNAIPLLSSSYWASVTGAINPATHLLYLSQGIVSGSSVTETFYSYNLQTGATAQVGSPYTFTNDTGCGSGGTTALTYGAYDNKIYQGTSAAGTIKVGLDGTITTIPVSPGCWAPSIPLVDPISGVIFESSAFWNIGMLANNVGTAVSSLSTQFTTLFNATPSNSWAANVNTYDPVSHSIYVGFNNGLVAKYGPSGTNAQWSSVPSAVSFLSTMNNNSNEAVIAAANGTMYWSGNGTLASSTPPPVSQSAFSTTLATVPGGIQSATIQNVVASNGTAGSVAYYLSNDNGATWVASTPGTPTTFATTTGTTLKYRVDFTGDATVSSFTLSYNDHNYIGTLQNFKINAEGAAQMVSLGWATTIPSNTQILFRTRGANTQDSLYSAQWSATILATNGSGTASILPNTGDTTNTTPPTDQYLEVQATLISSNGVAVPAITSIVVTYAQNGAPDFDPSLGNGAGATAGQINIPYSGMPSLESSSNYGKVRIDYRVRDQDTSSGSVTPGFITPSFQYRLSPADTWHNITTIADAAGNATNAVSNKAVTEIGYTAYTAYWNAAQDIPNTYSTTAQVRITANDNEVINNIAYATTSAFAIETKQPSVSVHIDGSSSTSTVSISASSSVPLLNYTVSNNSNGTADGVNGSSGVNQEPPSLILDALPLSFALSIPWTLDTGTSTHSVTVVTKDIFNNIATTTVLAPATLDNFEAHDISNATTNTYQLFLAWSLYGGSDPFQAYQIWRSTDGTTYSPFQTVTTAALNYYLDMNLSSTTSYYYKERTVDQAGNLSDFTPTSKVTPTGSGCSSLPPVMTTPVVSNLGNTSATITWSTPNNLADGVVTYGMGGFSGIASTTSYLNTHTVYLTNLQAHTTYQYKVTSTDICRNTNSEDNGYTFTTVSGPVITAVAHTEDYHSATITWNTDTAADSQVFYWVSADPSHPLTAGSGTATTTHSVTLTNLQALTPYSFYVTSTDANSITSADHNTGGSNYTLTTGKDSTPPTITDIVEPVIDAKNIVVTWNTDKPADTQVEYGTVASTTDGNYTTNTVLDTTLGTFHVATLSGLTPSTAYYFRIIANDALGNRGVSDEQMVTTSATEVIVVQASSGGAGSTNNPTPVVPVAPKISSMTVDPIDTFDATVNVVTDKDVRVGLQYGATSSSTPTATYTDSASSWTPSANTSIKINNLLPGTTYHYLVSVISKDGLTAQSTDASFTTKFSAEDLGDLSALSKAVDIQSKLEDIIQSALPSINPPFMTTPIIASTTQDSTTISWSTNVPAYTVLDYDTDAAYQKTHNYTAESSDLKIATTTHQLTLTNLAPNTKYHFITKAFIFPQVIAKSSDYTVTTKAGPITPQVLDVKPDSFRVLWTTSIQTSSSIDFTDRTTGTIQTLKDATLTLAHDLTANNLVSGHTYDVKAYGYDADGNLITMTSTLPVTTLVDKTLPQVTSLRIDSNLVPGRTDIVQSIVSWKTDKPSTSAVYYEEGSGNTTVPLKNKVENDTGFVQDHVVLLPSLKPSTIYRIQVSSTDQAGNTETLPVRTVVTPQQSESIVDIIFKNFSTTFSFIK